MLEFREELEKLGIVGTYADVRGSENGFFERVELHLRRLLQRPELSASTPISQSVRIGGPRTQPGPPIVPADYLAWLQPRCASVDLFGLEPKHGSAAKLHSIYVPLTTTPGGVGTWRTHPRRRHARATPRTGDPPCCSIAWRESRCMSQERRAPASRRSVAGSPGSPAKGVCRASSTSILPTDTARPGRRRSPIDCRSSSVYASSIFHSHRARERGTCHASISKPRSPDGWTRTWRVFPATFFAGISPRARRCWCSTAWTRCR